MNFSVPASLGKKKLSLVIHQLHPKKKKNSNPFMVLDFSSQLKIEQSVSWNTGSLTGCCGGKQAKN